MMVVSFILMVVWPAIYNALVSFGEAIIGLGPIGAGIYGFFNRLLMIWKESLNYSVKECLEIKHR